MGDTDTTATPAVGEPTPTDVKPPEGDDEMAKKNATTTAKKPEAAKPAPKTAAAKPEKKTAQAPAAPKTPRAKKEPLKIKAPKGVTVNETKYVITAEQGEKRMWVRGASVGLTHKVTGLKGFKAVTEEEAKKNHLGKTRMLGKVNNQDELTELVTKYFA